MYTVVALGLVAGDVKRPKRVTSGATEVII